MQHFRLCGRYAPLAAATTLLAVPIPHSPLLLSNAHARCPHKRLPLRTARKAKKEPARRRAGRRWRGWRARRERGLSVSVRTTRTRSFARTFVMDGRCGGCDTGILPETSSQTQGNSRDSRGKLDSREFPEWSTMRLREGAGLLRRTPATATSLGAKKAGKRCSGGGAQPQGDIALEREVWVDGECRGGRRKGEGDCRPPPFAHLDAFA